MRLSIIKLRLVLQLGGQNLLIHHHKPRRSSMRLFASKNGEIGYTLGELI